MRGWLHFSLQWGMVVAAALSAGCVAVDVGTPRERDAKVRNWHSSEAEPYRSTLVDVKAEFRKTQDERGVEVGLTGEYREYYRRTCHGEKTVTQSQKRLSFGLFPGAAEEYSEPPGKSSTAHFEPDYPVAFFFGLLPGGLLVGLGTVYSLVWELPFGDYDCDGPESFSHLGLIGFHKYTTQGTARFPVPDSPAGDEVRGKTQGVSGPYVVELTIPELDWREQAEVGPSETVARFVLPEGDVERTVTARASFFGAGASGATAEALAKNRGRTYEFNVRIRRRRRRRGRPGRADRAGAGRDVRDGLGPTTDFEMCV